MAAYIPLSARLTADRQNRIDGIDFAELSTRLGYPAAELEAAVEAYRKGEFRGTLDEQLVERNELGRLVEAGISVEDVMLRYGCTKRGAVQRLAKIGYGTLDVQRIRRRLGLEQPKLTQKQQRSLEFHRKREERARQRAEREAARQAKRPALMLPPRVRAVIDPIARQEGVSLADMTGGRQRPAFVKARHRAILALYVTFPEESLTWIGRPFGLHPSTVREALMKSGAYTPRGRRVAAWAAALAA